MKRITFFAMVTALFPSLVQAADVFVLGYLKYDYFPLATRQTVEAGTAGNPSSAGTVLGSDLSGSVGVFESGLNFAANYATRFRGFFAPPASGKYVFYV